MNLIVNNQTDTAASVLKLRIHIMTTKEQITIAFDSAIAKAPSFFDCKNSPVFSEDSVLYKELVESLKKGVKSPKCGHYYFNSGYVATIESDGFCYVINNSHKEHLISLKTKLLKSFAPCKTFKVSSIKASSKQADALKIAVEYAEKSASAFKAGTTYNRSCVYGGVEQALIESKECLELVADICANEGWDNESNELLLIKDELGSVLTIELMALINGTELIVFEKIRIKREQRELKAKEYSMNNAIFEARKSAFKQSLVDSIEVIEVNENRRQFKLNDIVCAELRLIKYGRWQGYFKFKKLEEPASFNGRVSRGIYDDIKYCWNDKNWFNRESRSDSNDNQVKKLIVDFFYCDALNS